MLHAAVWIALIGVAATFAVESARYGLWAGSTPGPGLFPFSLALATVGLAVGLLCSDAWRHWVSERLEQRSDAALEDADRAVDHRRLFGYASGLVCFGSLLGILGFHGAAIVGLVIVLAVAERRPPISLLWVVGGIVLVAHLLFVVVLGVPLPKANISFRIGMG